MVKCEHLNFRDGEITHQKIKGDYVDMQVICPDCKKWLGYCWKIWSIEDLDKNKIIWKDKNNPLKEYD